MAQKSKPCAMIKREFKADANRLIRTIYCGCCGEWERLHSGAIVRYIERTW